MLKVDSDGTIHLTRGDTARLNIEIVNEATDDLYEVLSGDTLKLTVKRAITDSVPKIQKIITGSSMFHITPEDTKDLSFGKYVYDVELTFENGDVYTVIPPTTFELLKEVSC